MNLEHLAERLRDLHLTIAVAESAAGGLIAAALTRPPGSSAYFRAGIVAYDDDSKVRVLGIANDVFVRHGSVSAEAALELADAARRLFGCDMGIGETSVAGPGGASAAKPVGLSYVAVVGANVRVVRENIFRGERDSNRHAAVDAAIQLLEEALG